MLNNNTNPQQRKRTLFHWHRQLGLIVSILVIVLSVSGILLNHTEKLKLDSNYIQSEFLLKWYGINKPIITSYKIENNWISHAEDNLYFNKILIEKEISQITGAVTTKNFIAVSTQNALILLTTDG